MEPAEGVCGCVVVERGAWLHPSDWRRLLPCLSSLGLASPAIAGVGRKILPNLPWKREEAEKGIPVLPICLLLLPVLLVPVLCSELASPPVLIFYFGDRKAFLSRSLLDPFFSAEGRTLLTSLWLLLRHLISGLLGGSPPPFDDLYNLF